MDLDVAFYKRMEVVFVLGSRSSVDELLNRKTLLWTTADMLKRWGKYANLKSLLECAYLYCYINTNVELYKKVK